MADDAFLASEPDTIMWGRLPCGADAPVRTIRSGATIVIDTVSHEGLLDDQGSDPVAFFGSHGVAAAHVLDDAIRIAREVERDPLDGPHVVTGPIGVEGARPGDLLQIDVLELDRRTDYGIVSNRHGRGALPGEFPEPAEHGHVPAVHSTFASVERSAARGEHGVIATPVGPIRFPLNEFLGIMGVAPVGAERPHSVPPGRHGGNLDVKHLGRGSRLFLPIQVDGALVYAGDPHFAQGNGEVALTAFEAPLRARLRLTVHAGLSADASEVFGQPFGETDEHWITIGLDPDLDVAMANATRLAVALLHERFGVPRGTALAYLSAAGDFEVSQVVDRVKGVHCCIRKADVEELADRFQHRFAARSAIADPPR